MHLLEVHIIEFIFLPILIILIFSYSCRHSLGRTKQTPKCGWVSCWILQIPLHHIYVNQIYQSTTWKFCWARKPKKGNSKLFNLWGIFKLTFMIGKCWFAKTERGSASASIRVASCCSSGLLIFFSKYFPFILTTDYLYFSGSESLMQAKGYNWCTNCFFVITSE